MPPHETPSEAACAAAAIAAAETIRHLDPGALAALRRMKAESAAPAFWRLAAQHRGTIGRQDLVEQWKWTAILRILAILTPRGEPDKRPPLHNPSRSLGAVLCDGGDPGWPGDERPRPVFSERRLAQLMAARGTQRAVLLTRAARALARSMQPGSGVNVPDIALALLFPDDGRRLAEPYYRRLDRAEQEAARKSKGETD